MSFAPSTPARIAVEPVQVNPSVASAVAEFCKAGRPAVLESSLGGRFSILADEPVDEFVFDHGSGGCPFQALAEHSRNWPNRIGEPELPFCGGWIGFFCYESGLSIEGIHPRTLWDYERLPLARFRLYDAAGIYDHERGAWSAAAVDWPVRLKQRVVPTRQRLARIRRRLESAISLKAFGTGERPSTEPSPGMSQADHAQRVARAKEDIAAGDVYQVNLAIRFTAQTALAPSELYARLRGANPAPYAAFLGGADFSILSASPELFLDLREGRVVTCPIKGTRPRGPDPAADAAIARELASSEKDAAELAMIVDLMRNDLGRVCCFGTVRVVEPARIERHPTVFHRVATVEGRLDEGRTWVDLLRATFPGGSVTGAPKIRAMQIIDELEPTARGVYCGAIGMIGLDGAMTLNLAIRTMVQSKNLVYFHAGGAIVADSNADEEFAEILAKAQGMAQALR